MTEKSKKAISEELMVRFDINRTAAGRVRNMYAPIYGGVEEGYEHGFVYSLEDRLEEFLGEYKALTKQFPDEALFKRAVCTLDKASMLALFKGGLTTALEAVAASVKKTEGRSAALEHRAVLRKLASTPSDDAIAWLDSFEYDEPDRSNW